MIDLQKYFINGEINIPEKDWSALKQSNSREDLVLSLNDLVIKNNIPFFCRSVSIEKCLSDFDKLKKFDTKKLVFNAPWKSKFQYGYALSDLFIGKTPIGKDASNYFMQPFRHSVGSHSKSSLLDAWNDEKKRMQTFNALFTMRRARVNNSTILQTAECKHYLPSAFRPTAAKTIYELFNATKILDMSAGWGDRLVASCGREYKGFDPNLNIKDIYPKIIETHGLNANVESIPFEDAVLADGYYDIMFTSPPYFKCEIYSNDSTQSCNRYKTLDEWIYKFLFYCIDKIYKAIKTGGIIAINISDININRKRVFICDKMNDYLKSKGMEYVGCYGLKLSKLPNTQENDGSVFGEPIWIWKKI